MRKIILGLAVSLDGYIEGPKGEYDWCFTDKDYGMMDFMKRIDAFFIGRKTYEAFMKPSKKTKSTNDPFASYKKYIFSKTLTTVSDGMILINGDIEEEVKRIQSAPGKDIWLFGGAGLATSLMDRNLIDELWLSIHPVILGGGKPLFNSLVERKWLTLHSHKIYDNGLVQLSYLRKK